MNLTQKQKSKTPHRITGVFGWPVKHSLSPAMHNAAFKHAGLNYSYLPFEVEPANCAALLKLLPKIGIYGINLTVPHKYTAFKNVDMLSKEAKLSQAVNTIVVKNGKLFGTSTDGEGLIRSLREEAGFEIKGKRVIILGAGGAGRSAAVYLAVKGAKEIVIANRTTSKSQNVMKLIKKHSPKTIVSVVPLTDISVKRKAFNADLIINATSKGLKVSDKPVICSKVFNKGNIFYDMIYNPSITSTMKEAKKAGAKTFNGLGMLLHQGALSWELWTGRKAPLKVMRKALLTALNNS